MRLRQRTYFSPLDSHDAQHVRFPIRPFCSDAQAAEPVTTRDQYAWIAAVSANDEDIGSSLADAMIRVGTDGKVLAEEGPDLTDTVEYTEGMEVDTGFINPKLVKDQETMMTTLEQPRVLVTDEKLQLMTDMVGILEQVVAEKTPLLIVTPDMVGEAMAGMILNLNRGVIDCAVIRAPGFGDVRRAYLQDICTYTGATFITGELGRTVKSAVLDDLGTLDKVTVSKLKTLLVGHGNAQATAVDERVAQIKSHISELADKTNKEFEIQRLEQRIQKLRGAVARIKVGGATDTEIKDKMLRYEDATNALRGAIAEGMLPGGGSTLAFMRRYKNDCKESIKCKEEQVAVDVLVDAMGVPVRGPRDCAVLRVCHHFDTCASPPQPPLLSTKTNLSIHRSVQTMLKQLATHPAHSICPFTCLLTPLTHHASLFFAVSPRISNVRDLFILSPPPVPLFCGHWQVTQVADNAGQIGLTIREKLLEADWG